MSKIAIIRIKGKIGIKKEIIDTLDRLRLRKKYACVVIEDTKENIGMIKRVHSFVAYGNIDDETYKELVNKRGKKDISGKLKPFFRLHPPRKGIKAKLHVEEGGVLGNHKEKINDLIRRML
ncbi:MAG: uL30 family ribosomal protein [Candidatus Pacearchaeota archaeon]|jgi:large subunit ribosomal protein L30